MSKLSEHYDELYSKNPKAFGLGEPEAFVLEASKLIPDGGEVIEFGAGQGRNALALADSGFNVLAVEISPVAVDLMNKVARDKALKNFQAEVGDAKAPMEREYDFVVSTFMLHHLADKDAREFIERIKKHTRIGGVHAISTFTADGDFFKLENSKGRFFPGLGELKELYADWDVIKYSEDTSKARATKEDGSPMINIKAEIIAKRTK